MLSQDLSFATVSCILNRTILLYHQDRREHVLLFTNACSSLTAKSLCSYVFGYDNPWISSVDNLLELCVKANGKANLAQPHTFDLPRDSWQLDQRFRSHLHKAVNWFVMPSQPWGLYQGDHLHHKWVIHQPFNLKCITLFYPQTK